MGLFRQSSVRRIAQGGQHPGGDLFHVALAHAARGAGGGAETDARGAQRRPGVVRDHLLVGGHPDAVERLLRVAAVDAEASKKAIEWIRGIVAEPEVGVIYNGKVVKTAEFGAFVNFLGSKDGLVHISELQQGRVNKTTDVVNQGDAVKVKVIGFDDRGKVKLSMRMVDQATGADISDQVGPKGGDRAPRGERPARTEGEQPAE